MFYYDFFFSCGGETEVSGVDSQLWMLVIGIVFNIKMFQSVLYHHITGYNSIRSSRSKQEREKETMMGHTQHTHTSHHQINIFIHNILFIQPTLVHNALVFNTFYNHQIDSKSRQDIHIPPKVFRNWWKREACLYYGSNMGDFVGLFTFPQVNKQMYWQ